MTSKTKRLPCRMRLLSGSLTLILPLLLASCATTAGLDRPVVNDNGCSWAKPIYVSGQDVLTDGTAKQIRDHDETGARICGWKPNLKQ